MGHGRFGSLKRWKIMQYGCVHWIRNHKISGWLISHKKWRWLRYIWKLCKCIHAYQQCSISRNYHTVNSVLRWTSEQTGFYTDIAVRRHKTWIWLQRFQLQWHQLHILGSNFSSSSFIIVNPWQHNHIILWFIWCLVTTLPSLTIRFNRKLCNCIYAYQQCAISCYYHTLHSVLRWTSEQLGFTRTLMFRWMHMVQPQRDQIPFSINFTAFGNYSIVSILLLLWSVDGTHFHLIYYLYPTYPHLFSCVASFNVFSCAVWGSPIPDLPVVYSLLWSADHHNKTNK